MDRNTLVRTLKESVAPDVSPDLDTAAGRSLRDAYKPGPPDVRPEKPDFRPEKRDPTGPPPSERYLSMSAADWTAVGVRLAELGYLPDKHSAPGDIFAVKSAVSAFQSDNAGLISVRGVGLDAGGLPGPQTVRLLGLEAHFAGTASVPR